MELNILQVIQGVNMGDHGETVTNAVTVSPETTVAELAERALTQGRWGAIPGLTPPDRKPIRDAYLVIRIAEPLEAPTTDGADITPIVTNDKGEPFWMDEYECCASGSCEVCRRPVGYTQQQREEIRDYEPPWVRQRREEGWGR